MQNALIAVGVMFACVSAVYVLCKLYERVVDRHRKAAQDARDLREEGYPDFIADWLESYAFNDIRGQVDALRRARAVSQDPASRRQAREAFLRHQLEKACTDVERLNKFAAIVSQYAPAVAAINAVVAAAAPVTAPVTVPVATVAATVASAT